MTDEIIKAFNEYCKGVVDGYYDHISHGGKGDEHEEKHIDMICGIRDIINRQKVEIKELRKGLDIWTDIAHRETQYVEQAKTEAYKEFAERLKQSTFFMQDEDGFDSSVVYVSDIDRKLKELSEVKRQCVID